MLKKYLLSFVAATTISNRIIQILPTLLSSFQIWNHIVIADRTVPLKRSLMTKDARTSLPHCRSILAKLFHQRFGYPVACRYWKTSNLVRWRPTGDDYTFDTACPRWFWVKIQSYCQKYSQNPAVPMANNLKGCKKITVTSLCPG